MLVQCASRKHGSSVSQRIVVPDVLQPLVLRLCHDDAAVDHPGEAGSLYALLRRFYWPSAGRDVNLYVRSCAKCLARKTLTTRNTEQVAVSQPTEFGDTLQIDLLDMHVVTKAGNRCVFAAVDRASDFCYPSHC